MLMRTQSAIACGERQCRAAAGESCGILIRALAAPPNGAPRIGGADTAECGRAPRQAAAPAQTRLAASAMRTQNVSVRRRAAAPCRGQREPSRGTSRGLRAAAGESCNSLIRALAVPCPAHRASVAPTPGRAGASTLTKPHRSVGQAHPERHRAGERPRRAAAGGSFRSLKRTRDHRTARAEA